LENIPVSTISSSPEYTDLPIGFRFLFITFTTGSGFLGICQEILQGPMSGTVSDAKVKGWPNICSESVNFVRRIKGLGND